MTPFLFVVVRFGMSTLILTVLFPRKLATFTRQSWGRGAILAVLLFAGFMLQNWGLQITTASKSAFITGMLVVFTPIFQLLWEKKMPTIGNIIGVVLAAIGLFFLTAPEGSSFNAGDAMTVGCAFLFAIYIVYLDIASVNTDRYHLVYGQISITALLGFIGMLIFEKPHMELSTGMLLGVGYLTLLATLLTTFVQTRYQGDTTPTRAAIIFTTEPVIAAVLAYYVRNEILGLIGIIGGVIIITGLLISELSGESRFLNREIFTNNKT